jgi:SAM-dependent methyltransferase
MTIPEESLADAYEDLYREFDSPLIRQLRREAYGEDIGQHSWVRADELRADIQRLNLSRTSRLLDLGCGPCGPLTFILAATGCRGTGVELSPSALRVGRKRAASLGVDSLLTILVADLNDPLPFEPRSFEAVMSLDAVLHLRDRLTLFNGIANLLCPGGRFLFTDAGVVTGCFSNDEMHKRSAHGYTQFTAAGWNERLLESAGFRLLETEDRTGSVLKNASGRLAAMHAHRTELERVSGSAAFESQAAYLEVAVELARRRAVSRMMYLAEARSASVL